MGQTVGLGGRILNSVTTEANETQVDVLELARQIVDVIVEGKGEDVLLLDIREASIIADYFVIASVNSMRQGKVLTEKIRQQLKHELALSPLSVEGDSTSEWVLMDYGSVVVHIFMPATRAYYDLEGLWRDGRVVIRML